MKISTSKVFALALIATMFSVFSTSNSKAAEALKIGPAEVSFNASYMSNYIWRGLDQNANDGSASFGIDLALPKTIYFGAWTAGISDVGNDGSSQELDFYAGIAPSFGSANFDIGYIAYTYPGHRTPGTNFGEWYAGAEFAPEGKPFTVGAKIYQDDAGENLQTTEFSASYDAGIVALSAVMGDQEKRNEYWSVTASKEMAGIGFALTYSDNEQDTADVNKDKEYLTLTLSKSF
jgi:uncharacterized protein (TIGR02001 family)